MEWTTGKGNIDEPQNIMLSERKLYKRVFYEPTYKF